ncbi:BLUF domain-containing protein [Sphingomonas sp.]|jgi:hypothetical protein|uniref:BLUF domain-containing protein n=1 Tax=Sphingomonas sp. TaxID=28214 RepID=UPI002634FBFC|nr:BLUF domain-containing protein [Sphingomonas sp.]MDF2495479.1 hypothetical protein [Sphingomonas sp.]
MSLLSLLYVSTSCLRLPAEEDRVNDIVAVARARNAALEVTGALMFVETHFAQVLEGSADAVATLMDSIRADPRHTRVTLVDTEWLVRRRFARWTMAYAGPRTLVEAQVAPVLALAEGNGSPFAPADLIALMLQFASLED